MRNALNVIYVLLLNHSGMTILSSSSPDSAMYFTFDVKCKILSGPAVTQPLTTYVLRVVFR